MICHTCRHWMNTKIELFVWNHCFAESAFEYGIYLGYSCHCIKNSGVYWLWQWNNDNVSRLIQIVAKWSSHNLCNQCIYYAMTHASVFSCMISEIESTEDLYCISSLLECEIKWVHVAKAPKWHWRFLQVPWKYQICFIRKLKSIPYESLFICKHCVHKNTNLVLLHIQSVDMERYQNFSCPCSVMPVHKITVA